MASVDSVSCRCSALCVSLRDGGRRARPSYRELRDGSSVWSDGFMLRHIKTMKRG